MQSAYRTEPHWLHLTLMVLLFSLPVAFSSQSEGNSCRRYLVGNTMDRTKATSQSSRDGNRGAGRGRKEVELGWAAGRTEIAEAGFRGKSIQISKLEFRSYSDSTSSRETGMSPSSTGAQRRRVRSWESFSDKAKELLRRNLLEMGWVMRPRAPVPQSAPIQQIHSVPSNRKLL